MFFHFSGLSLESFVADTDVAEPLGSCHLGIGFHPVGSTNRNAIACRVCQAQKETKNCPALRPPQHRPLTATVMSTAKWMPKQKLWSSHQKMTELKK
jgi:hypothetical protein